MKKVFTRYFLLILAALAFAVNCACQDIGSVKPQGYVSDFAGVISDDDKTKISAIMQELDSKTTAEIAVVTVKNIGDMPVEEYAVKLFEKWGIGKKGKDNGLLILAIMDRHEVKIEVGYGLEGIINDAKAGDIIRDKIVPAFRQEKYGEGLFDAVASVANLIAKDAGVELSGLKDLPQQSYEMNARSNMSDAVSFIIFILIVLIFGFRGLLFPFLLGGFWRGGGGGFGGSGGFGGGFGGFGGGMSGGGGASGRW